VPPGGAAQAPGRIRGNRGQSLGSSGPSSATEGDPGLKLSPQGAANGPSASILLPAGDKCKQVVRGGEMLRAGSGLAVTPKKCGSSLTSEPFSQR
jgi:hypothetical protein